MEHNKLLPLDEFKSDFIDCSNLFRQGLQDAELQERILTLVEQFSGMSHEKIVAYLEGFLPNDSVGVFSNFHKNLTSFKNIITLFSDGNTPSKDELRSHFLNSKHINSLLFCDEYREILDYIQTGLSDAAKVEIYMDINAYFSHGCYEEDKKNNPKLNATLTPAKRFNLIKKLSEQRNIGVAVKYNPRDERCSVHCGAQQLSKSGMAKSGYIDRVKVTPNGLVILLGTSDGKLSLKKEPLQLRDHIKALCIGIANQELIHDKQIYSIENIHDISFNILTEFTTEKSEPLQAAMINCGLNIETMRFLHSSFIPFLEEPCIDDLVKYRCSMNGIACNGLSREEIKNIDQFILKTLQNINSNMGKIHKLVDDGGKGKVREFITELSSFLEKSQQITNFSNHDEILLELSKINSKPFFSNLFPTGLSVSHLMDGFEKNNQLKKRSLFTANYEKNKTHQLNEQKNLLESYKLEQSRINSILESEPFNVKPLFVRQAIEFNKLNDFRVNENGEKSSTKEILMSSSAKVAQFKRLNNKLRGLERGTLVDFDASDVNLTLAQRLWAKNNPDIIFKVDPEFSKKNTHPLLINKNNEKHKEVFESLIRDISFLHPTNSTPTIRHSLS